LCDPISLTAIAVASAATSVIGEVQAANANNKAVNAQNIQRKKEIDQAATADINDRLREARREQGRIAAAAGEAGLSLGSGSVEALLLDSAQQAGLANSRSLANRESRKAASDAQAQTQITSKPTLLGAALKIGLSGGAAYAGASKKP